jgi:hypothetical protein
MVRDGHNQDVGMRIEDFKAELELAWAVPGRSCVQCDFVYLAFPQHPGLIILHLTRSHWSRLRQVSPLSAGNTLLTFNLLEPAFWPIQSHSPSPFWISNRSSSLASPQVSPQSIGRPMLMFKLSATAF